MARLFGTEYTRNQILRHVGSMDQLCGARRVVLDEGNEKGSEAVQFHTGSGLNFTALAGRALDISSADWCGQSLCWRSPVGDTAAAFYEPEGLGWLRGFYGGLVCTCGLSWAGAPHADPSSSEGGPLTHVDADGQAKWQPTGSLGLHGRISNVPAKHLSVCEWWDGDDYWMSAFGEMREAVIFGTNLLLRRTVKAKLGESKIWIHDEVENQSFAPQEHMFLYHCNLGFPVIAEGAEYLINSRQVTPRDEVAAPHLDSWKQFPAPIPGVEEWVYYHDVASDEAGNVTLGMANRNANGGHGLGIYMKYSKQQLPYFIQWKMPGESTYVTGLEPANCLVEGRVKDRQEGRLVVLEPGEMRSYDLEIGVLVDNTEIDALAAEVELLQ